MSHESPSPEVAAIHRRPLDAHLSARRRTWWNPLLQTGKLKNGNQARKDGRNCSREVKAWQEMNQAMDSGQRWGEKESPRGSVKDKVGDWKLKISGKREKKARYANSGHRLRIKLSTINKRQANQKSSSTMVCWPSRASQSPGVTGCRFLAVRCQI